MYIVMSEFPNAGKCSSTQAISPLCLNVFTSNLIQRFFGYISLHTFVKNICLDQNYTQFFCHISLLFCKLLAFCDGAHRYFNIQQSTTSSVYQSCCPMGWYRFLIGTLLQLPRKCNYLWPLFQHLSSLVQRLYQISKSYNVHWTEQVWTILHSEFHFDRAYSGFRKGSDRNIVQKWRRKKLATKAYLIFLQPKSIYSQSTEDHVLISCRDCIGLHNTHVL